MILFQSNKPYLKDLIPPGYVDMHSHLLAGIDDGSKSLDESMDLIQKLSGIGFHQFITTPHVITNVWNNTTEQIKLKEKELNQYIEETNRNAQPIKAAAEYMMDSYLFESLKKEKILTIKDNYVLVELSYTNAPLQLFEIIFELQIRGYQPILAHPERYLYFQKNFSQFEKLKKLGVLFQLNLLAVTGYYGKEVLELAEKLLKKGMYNFTGSDVHNQRHVNCFDHKLQIKNHTTLRECMLNNACFSF